MVLAVAVLCVCVCVTPSLPNTPYLWDDTQKKLKIFRHQLDLHQILNFVTKIDIIDGLYRGN